MNNGELVDWYPFQGTDLISRRFWYHSASTSTRSWHSENPLNVIGIGTDICDCGRIEEMIRKHGEVFLDRVFTAGEQGYCSRHKASDQHFAGRWAAKESILKALGTGWAKGIGWTDLEIYHLEGGKPKVRLHGAAEVIAAKMGIREVLISISHTSTTAIAFAIAVGPANDSNFHTPEPNL